MPTIPTGYRLAVIDPTGTIVDTIDLSDTEPEKPLAACLLGTEVAAIVTRSAGQVTA